MQMARWGDTSSPFTEAGFCGHRGCAPAPPNPSGLKQHRKEPGAGVINTDKHRAKSSDFQEAWEQGRGEDTCTSAGGLSCCSAALAAAAKCVPLPQLSVPSKSAVCQGWERVPCPTAWVSGSVPPPSFLHRPWGCRLVRLEKTGHHFEVIFLESKQHLTLHLFWWTARKVSCPVAFLVVATVVARHRNIFDCTSNSLCFLLDE